MTKILLYVAAACLTLQGAERPFTVVEAGIPAMRAAMEQERITSRGLVTQYLLRIAVFDNKLRATITVNPAVLAIADERDRERKQGKIRGPLHGIPIALKDNIQTMDMPTTGGALAFDGFTPPYEASGALIPGASIVVTNLE